LPIITCSSAREIEPSLVKQIKQLNRKNEFDANIQWSKNEWERKCYYRLICEVLEEEKNKRRTREMKETGEDFLNRN